MREGIGNITPPVLPTINTAAKPVQEAAELPKPIPNLSAIALSSYQAVAADELSFEEGDVIGIIDMAPEVGKIYGVLDGRVGWVSFDNIAITSKPQKPRMNPTALQSAIQQAPLSPTIESSPGPVPSPLPSQAAAEMIASNERLDSAPEYADSEDEDMNEIKDEQASDPSSILSPSSVTSPSSVETPTTVSGDQQSDTSSKKGSVKNKLYQKFLALSSPKLSESASSSAASSPNVSLSDVRASDASSGSNSPSVSKGLGGDSVGKKSGFSLKFKSSRPAILTSEGNNVFVVGAPATARQTWAQFAGGQEAIEKLGLTPQEVKRQEVIYEIFLTERDYLADLNVIVEVR